VSENLIEPGARFGKLVALKELPEDSAHRQRWVFKCACGREEVRIVSTLLRQVQLNKTPQCLSCRKRRFKISPRDRFGKLTAIKPLSEKRWLVQCDCGRQEVRIAYNLYQSQCRGSVSCCNSCKHKLSISEGDRFGKFVAVKETDPTEDGSQCWVFRCDCGNEEIRRVSLMRYQVSCGKVPTCKICRGVRTIVPGQQFGRLTAVERRPSAPGYNQQWLFRCSCGNEVQRVVSVIRMQLKHEKFVACTACKHTHQRGIKRAVIRKRLAERFEQTGSLWYPDQIQNMIQDIYEESGWYPEESPVGGIEPSFWEVHQALQADESSWRERVPLPEIVVEDHHKAIQEKREKQAQLRSDAMLPGSCYLLQWSKRWKQAPDKVWRPSKYKPKGDEKFRGVRGIDGVNCKVHLCGDGRYRAQPFPEYLLK
jgi:hypothetical protein